MPDGTMLVENSKELQAKLDQIFHKTEKIKAKTVVTPKKGQDNSRKRSRFQPKFKSIYSPKRSPHNKTTKH
jgi:hypothetical protein